MFSIFYSKFLNKKVRVFEICKVFKKCFLYIQVTKFFKIKERINRHGNEEVILVLNNFEANFTY